MVAVLADQGLSAGSVQRAPGIGPDGRVVVVQTKLPLRHGDRLTYRRWDADFNNCALGPSTSAKAARRAGRRSKREPLASSPSSTFTVIDLTGDESDASDEED